jgi:formylglycine-generating enzyme required for sulfatase activity
MSGNAREGCITAPPDTSGRFRICRGGAWPGAPLLMRVASRTAFPPENINYYSSGRLVCLPRLERGAGAP